MRPAALPLHRLPLLCLALALVVGSAAGQAPDAVYLGGNIYTLDPARPRAAALAVTGNRLTAVGSDAEIVALAGRDTVRIDLGGATVVPGLIDAHGHLAGLGNLALGRLDLVDTRSYDDLLAAVGDRVGRTEPGQWILGGRWDQASWGERDLPDHARLSEASPDHPVFLTRVDGHAALANARALAAAGIVAGTPDPPGGKILRRPDGSPTGVLVDNAMGLVHRVLPGGTGVDTADAILAAQDRCLAVGLTGVHDAGIGIAELAVLRRLAEEGTLRLRVYAMLSSSAALVHAPDHPPLIGHADGRLTVRAIKCMVDGAMGSRGAWLLEPYSDFPVDEAGRPYTGLPVQSPASILRVCRVALEHGYQVATHAIGDRGNREVLDVYEQALAERPVDDHRFRIEHAQLVAGPDIERFARLGVIPSMQPTHATSDMRWARDRVGPERLEGAYAWGRFLRAGCRLAAGSDFPVESENPLLGFHAAVTRTDLRGRPPGGWRPVDRLTRHEALRAFTLDAAHAAFEEDHKGSLVPGKLADFVVLSGDIMTCPSAAIPTTIVRRTVIGGQTVYESE